MKPARFVLLLAALFSHSAQAAELVEVARSPQLMWNGVTVFKTGRIFASFPAMHGENTIGVGEILPDGSIRPYPGGAWNDAATDAPSHERFVGINAVVSDAADQLWVVDPAGGFGSKPQPGEAKLVQVDLATDKVVHVYPFSTEVVPEGGFINDVRVGDKHAFITDSDHGALIERPFRLFKVEI